MSIMQFFSIIWDSEFSLSCQGKGRVGTLSNLLTVTVPDSLKVGPSHRGSVWLPSQGMKTLTPWLKAGPLAQTADVRGENCVCNLSSLTSCKTLGMLLVFSNLQIFHLLQEDINCAPPPELLWELTEITYSDCRWAFSKHSVNIEKDQLLKIVAEDQKKNKTKPKPQNIEKGQWALWELWIWHSYTENEGLGCLFSSCRYEGEQGKREISSTRKYQQMYKQVLW